MKSNKSTGTGTGISVGISSVIDLTNAVQNLTISSKDYNQIGKLYLNEINVTAERLMAILTALESKLSMAPINLAAMYFGCTGEEPAPPVFSFSPPLPSELTATELEIMRQQYTDEAKLEVSLRDALLVLYIALGDLTRYKETHVEKSVEQFDNYVERMVQKPDLSFALGYYTKAAAVAPWNGNRTHPPHSPTT